MSQIIIHHDNIFNIYSTVTDVPIFSRGVSAEELREYIKFSFGNQGLEQLPARIERARKIGTSSILGESLEQLIKLNRAGKSEAPLPVTEFIDQFLSGDKS
jgi:hypothetical protein